MKRRPPRHQLISHVINNQSDWIDAHAPPAPRSDQPANPWPPRNVSEWAFTEFFFFFLSLSLSFTGFYGQRAETADGGSQLISLDDK